MKSCFFKGNITTLNLDFFDSAFTFSNESIQVPCCARDTTLTNVTCGEGLSCTGQCSAIGATLCPSGNCTENPEDCRLSPLLDQEEGHSRKGPSISALPSWAFKWCAPRCKVHYHAVCCFYPTCRRKKWDQCNWFES